MGSNDWKNLIRNLSQNDAPQTQRIISRAWNFLYVGLLLLGMVVLYLLAMGVGQFFYEEQIVWVQLIVGVVVYLLLFGLIVFFKNRQELSWEAAFGMSRDNFKTIRLAPLFYLTTLPFLILAAGIGVFILKSVFGIEPVMQDAAQAIMDGGFWIRTGYIFVALLIAPIFEEILFRGILFPVLVRRVGLIQGAGLVAFLFAGMHFNAIAFLPLYLFSMVLCWAYWKTGSLWVNVGMHILFNLVSTLFLIFN